MLYITFNEPENSVYNGLVSGSFAPGKKLSNKEAVALVISIILNSVILVCSQIVVEECSSASLINAVYVSIICPNFKNVNSFLKKSKKMKLQMLIKKCLYCIILEKNKGVHQMFFKGID